MGVNITLDNRSRVRVTEGDRNEVDDRGESL